MYKVFLVDDDELILDQIVNTIPWMENGFEVIGCESDAVVALKKVFEIKPHVVFIDLKMPKLDGHSFIHSVREQGMDTEFIMLSAFGTFEDARTFFQQDGFDYLLKPLQMQEAQMVLEKMAEKLIRKYPMLTEYEEEIVNPAFAELTDYLQNSFAEKFTLEELSKRFGISAGYICNLFAKHYSTTLTRYVTRIRMEYAVSEMKKKELSLKNIATACGYRDYFYFNKVFRGYYGEAPSQYMKNMDAVS